MTTTIEQARAIMNAVDRQDRLLQFQRDYLKEGYRVQIIASRSSQPFNLFMARALGLTEKDLEDRLRKAVLEIFNEHLQDSQKKIEDELA